jgi:23S rRNA pseudouridine955/2504/2580 synthase/23S rRNA pseudouridine1911/1915/1917 synthase
MKDKDAITVLYQDEALLIAAKPPGLLTIPDRFEPQGPNLQALLNEQYGRLWTVHRLDRETSGVICFARTEADHRALSMQFEARTVGKYYLALVDGRIGPDAGTIDAPIGPHPRQEGKMTVIASGKPAQTDYKVLRRFVAFTWVEARLHTGRTHQVRVHFQSAGHALAVDPLYGRRPALFLSEIKGKGYHIGKYQEERPLLERTALHAARLEVQHPRTGEPLVVEAPLPKDLRAVVQQLEKWGA